MTHSAVIILVFFAMEGVAYASHRWLMHGPMWVWHESHHQIRRGIFEKNDLFGLVFSLIAMAGIALGMMGSPEWAVALDIGVGMTLYGAAYLFLHDILVHRRFRITIHPRAKYLKAILRSHRVHHARRGRLNCTDFGFLVPGSGKHPASFPQKP
jgi:beta-carotene 3-hydroxylase